MTPFSALIASLQKNPEGHSIVLPPDWLQGRTTYGGLSASLCLEATQRSIENLPPLRSAQFCFVGPASGNLNLTAQGLRTGKSTTMVCADMVGDSGMAVRSTLCFGTGRASSHNYQALPMPQVASPHDCVSFFDSPEAPTFAKHFEAKFAGGAMPRTPDAKPEMTIWLRHRDVGDESSLVRLLALADALPPPSLVLSKEMMPFSTMTWSLDILDDRPFSTKGWWLAQARADTSQNGYSSHEIVIWSADGQPVVMARQNVAIFG